MSDDNENKLVEDNEVLSADDGLSLDDLSAGWISNPKVGESITFMVAKIRKLTGTELLGKDSKGKTFKKNLSNVNHGYEIETSNGDKYTIAAWEVFGKLKKIFQKLGQIADVEITIFHVFDGMIDKDREDDKYVVSALVDGTHKTLNRETKKWEELK